MHAIVVKRSRLSIGQIAICHSLRDTVLCWPYGQPIYYPLLSMPSGLAKSWMLAATVLADNIRILNRFF